MKSLAQTTTIRIPPQLGDSSSATGGASTKTERKSDQQQHSGKYMSHIALLGLNLAPNFHLDVS